MGYPRDPGVGRFDVFATLAQLGNGGAEHRLGGYHLAGCSQQPQRSLSPSINFGLADDV